MQVYFKQDDGYPMCGALLRAALPIYEQLQPRVFRLFVKHTRSEKLARQALTLGYYPLVSIAKIMTGGKHDRTKNGLYQGANGGARDIVYVNTPFPDSYEKEQRQGTAQTIEITVLHEMVHWARFVGGNPEGCEEAGAAFEKELYQIVSSRGGVWCN